MYPRASYFTPDQAFNGQMAPRQTGVLRLSVLTAKLRKSFFLNNLACISNNAVDIVQKLK
jgi:hypothetical protein